MAFAPLIRVWPLQAWITANLCVSCGFVAAQVVPDAGSLMQELREQERLRPSEIAPPTVVTPVVRPTIRLPEGATVRVGRFSISGNTAIPSAELAPLVAPWEGRTLDVAGLNEAASAITRHYQNRGFLLSYAYLPVQKIEQDRIEIAVLEGRVGEVQVFAASDVRLDDAVVVQHIGSPAGADPQPARQEDLERRLLLLNDISGVVARGAFTPGAEPGSSDLVVSVVEDEPLANTVYANNYGSRSTGELRLGAQFHLRDIFGIGDSTRLNLSLAAGGPVASGSLTSRVPIGGKGWSASAGVSHLTYELGGEFARLGARGEADSFQLGVAYAWLRGVNRNLTFSADYEYSKMRDLIPLVASESLKTSGIVSGGLRFDDRDPIGRSHAALTLRHGYLSLPSGTIDLLDKRGAFNKASFEFGREQSLGQLGQLYLRVSSQLSDRNLDSSEKFSLGGPNAVRAYGPGEAAADQATLITLEYRYVQALTGASLTWRVFHDHASGHIDDQPLAGTADNEVTLKGSGLGLSWNAGDFDLGLTAAWRGARLGTSNGDRKPRFYLQLVKGF